MWLSQNLAVRNRGQEAARSGAVSLPEASPGVITDGEQRQLQLIAPGGCSWRPAVGDGVLVIPDSAGNPCAAGLCTAAPVKLAPGELCLHAGSGWIYLCRDGSVKISAGHLTLSASRIDLDGNVYIEGERYQKGGTL